MRRDRLVSGDTTLARMWVLAAVAVVLGLIGGGAAVGLFKLIGLLTHLTLLGDVGFDLPTLRGYHPTPMLIVVAICGGLLDSVLAAWAPVIRGHGIPESLEAILDRDSRIRPRAAIAKPLSAAITIGTGGPFGAEGPIIVTGGSMGSLIGQLLSVSPAERKIMLATGAAAGMSATFNTPIAAVILAIELVLFERSLRVLVPLSIASGVAAAIHVVAFGAQPLFLIATQLHVGLAHLPLFAVVGVASGVLAIVLNKGLFAMEAAFRRLPVNIFFWPAIGAFGFAVIGLLVPRTLSMGYSAIVDTLNGQFTVLALAVLFGAKLLSWLIALGSQTSGGTLAPMFLVGATMGCLLGHALNAIFPALHVSPAAFALVAMGATFGASTKALLAAVVFAVEVTDQYSMVIPLLIGAAAAELVVEGFLSDRLMTEKLSHRGFRVEFRTAVDALRTRVARQVMREPVWVGGGATVADARRTLAAHGLDRIAVVGSDGRYQGLVATTDLTGTAGAAPTVGALAVRAIPPIRPDEYLSESMDRFLAHGVDALPVVENGLVIGLLSIADVSAERYRRGAAQELRQAGWLATLRWPRARPRGVRCGAEAAGFGPPQALSVPSGGSAANSAGFGCAKLGTEAPQRQHDGSGVETMVVSPTRPGTGHVARRPAHGRLLPDPVAVTPGLGQFVLSERSRIVLAWGSVAARPVAERLAAELRPATGYRLSVSEGRAYRDDICLRLTDAPELAGPRSAEGYVLHVGVPGVTLTAPTLHGLHNGTQTIRQLLPIWIASRRPVPGPWAMPAVNVVDFPRFGYRGLMLDLTRQVLSPGDVLRFVDRIAGYKLNTLHLRFSAEHARRLAAAEVLAAPAPDRSLPEAANAGAIRPGAFWAAHEFRRVAEYAAEHFVTLVPEVEPDGGAAVGRWPDHGEILARLAAMTPGPYCGFAAGGSSAEGAGAVAGWAAAGLAALGKTVLCRCEIGYAVAEPAADRPDATARRAPRFVISPTLRTGVDDPDAGESDLNVSAVYCWDPTAAESGLGEQQVLGVQAELPTAAMPTATCAERAAFPRLLGAAEVGWSSAAPRTSPGPELTDFVGRVAAQGPRLALTGTAFDAAESIPWRMHVTGVAAQIRHRTVRGTIGMLVAPGWEVGRLRATVDWGDGCVADAALTHAAAGAGGAADVGRAGVAGATANWFLIAAEHRYRRGGVYRAAITVTGPGAVPARASVQVRAGAGGRLHLPRREHGARPGVAGRLAAGSHVRPEAGLSVPTEIANAPMIESPSA